MAMRIANGLPRPTPSFIFRLNLFINSSLVCPGPVRGHSHSHRWREQTEPPTSVSSAHVAQPLIRLALFWRLRDDPESVPTWHTQKEMTKSVVSYGAGFRTPPPSPC